MANTRDYGKFKRRDYASGGPVIPTSGNPSMENTQQLVSNMGLAGTMNKPPPPSWALLNQPDYQRYYNTFIASGNFNNRMPSYKGN
jgi:hypothetical protein